MFQKPAFGSNTSGFGSFNAGASTSTFGGFKPTTGTSAFGAPPAFGAGASTQPTTGGGLFGASNPSTGLFGSTNTATTAPAFGASTSGFGFSANTSTGGLFGSNNTSTGLFGGAQNTSAFGAKPATGFGYGSTTTTGTTGGGLFGSTANTNTGLFGQQNTTLGGGGLFSNNTTGAFGQQATAAGTAHVKYNPVVGTDVLVKSGTSQSVLIKHHCITCMKEYEGKSLEELRLEDYTAGRKGATGGGVFSGFQNTMENKPLFGGNTSFGQPATTSAPSVFGGGGIVSSGGFGQTNTFSFGNAAQNNTTSTGLFGAAKPAFGTTATTGTGLFGATTTQAPSFGTSTATFGFGTNTQNQSTGLFGAKPATTGFGTTPANTAFGGFGNTGGLFGAKPQQTTAPAFGSTAPAFGALSTGFGTTTSTAGSLFSNVSFGKPANTQPTFGFNAQPNTLGGTLGGGLGGTLGGGLGAGAGTLGAGFGAKPAATTGFGPLATGGFPQAQPAPFRTGLDSGLGGGGMFNNTSLGGNALGLGMNVNNSALAGAGAGVHEQILALAARPYGDSPLFKDLVPEPSSERGAEALRPAGAAAGRAAPGYRVAAAPPPQRLTPRAHTLTDKKSLFDGLEESDASLEDKLTLKPSRKRLVLRQNKSDSLQNDSTDQITANRSLEEPSVQPEANGQSAEPERDHVDSGDRERVRRQVDFQDNNNLEVSSERHGSWLSSPKMPWADKEKPIEEPTPRIYPNLDKEMLAQPSERRASWLTTKPLRKPLISNPESAENSVRELGVRTDRQMDKENIDTLSVSEEENVSTREAPPHPAGVKLTRPGYYTIPSLDEITGYLRPDGSCVVPHLTIGRKNYGNVYYDCEIDVAGLDIDALVHFLNKEVIIYPEDADKPPVGEGLNRRAIVTLDRIWPRDKTEKRAITDPDRLIKMDYEGKLRRVCDKHDTKFIEYRPQTGSWVFRVEHFSKYGLTDSDEEDDITPDVIKRQLVHQQTLQTAAPAPKPLPVVGLGGLGGAASLSAVPGLSSGLSGGLSAGLGDDLYAMHQTSLDLLNGAGKAFEMDTTEDNAEAQSMYQERAFGVKSPTSELARLEHRQSHNVQLMKASLYADIEMEDDVSVSTGDQQVPLALPLLAETPIQTRSSPEPAPQPDSPVHTEEVAMKPLIVRPYTIVLQYHRKVPPFKQTIAGSLDAACIADMSVCRARHSRVGFGPAGSLTYVTSYDSLVDLPRTAELSELSQYVRGRSDTDWSEPIVARLAIGRGDTANYIQEALSRHLETLLEWSEPVPCSEESCPQLRVKPGARDRRQLLQRQLRDAAAMKNYNINFGVSGAYCYEVWKLCEALWGADLENEGIPGNDVQSIVNRHKKLLDWFTEAVAETTDRELAKPAQAEEGDETDLHSKQVWTLLLGGRLLEACKLCTERGDLNMATLLAQASGDPIFRSLLSRQLSLWRECGADALVGPYKLAALRLAGGLAQPRELLQQVDWLRALHATARFLCPQVPSLEKVINTYEGFFKKSEDDEPVDLATLEEDELGMKFPLPPYYKEYELASNRSSRRPPLDLRYVLLRARAQQTRPTLSPATCTPDPLDYSLCFLLGVWFGNPTVDSITGMADQLEGYGLWHLAIQVLAYHPNEIARGHLIRGVLGRHAPARARSSQAQAQLQLLQRLQLPKRWLPAAQAHRAKYEHLPAVEVEHLIGAEQWNAAHKVLLEELLPEAVLADDLKSIAPLLDKLNEAAERHEVNGWESGGQALYHYWHVCNEIRGLVSEGSAGARLEALRPRLAAACRALAALHATSARHGMARAEMGARLLQLSLAAREPPRRLAALLRALRLPPDCAAPALAQITLDLAEQASELCCESVASSPLSSTHVAAVNS